MHRIKSRGLLSIYFIINHINKETMYGNNTITWLFAC